MSLILVTRVSLILVTREEGKVTSDKRQATILGHLYSIPLYFANVSVISFIVHSFIAPF
jgi:hypothetical protein